METPRNYAQQIHHLFSPSFSVPYAGALWCFMCCAAAFCKLPCKMWNLSGKPQQLSVPCSFSLPQQNNRLRAALFMPFPIRVILIKSGLPHSSQTSWWLELPVLLNHQSYQKCLGVEMGSREEKSNWKKSDLTQVSAQLHNRFSIQPINLHSWSLQSSQVTLPQVDPIKMEKHLGCHEFRRHSKRSEDFTYLSWSLSLHICSFWFILNIWVL